MPFKYIDKSETVGLSDAVLLVRAPGKITITIPAISEVPPGFSYGIRNLVGATVIIMPAAGNIQGAPFAVMKSADIGIANKNRKEWTVIDGEIETVPKIIIPPIPLSYAHITGHTGNFNVSQGNLIPDNIAGSRNVGLGAHDGKPVLRKGSDNVFLGYKPSNNDVSNQIAIGSGHLELVGPDVDNVVRVGTTKSYAVYAPASTSIPALDFTGEESDLGLEFVKSLKPRRLIKDGLTHYGFLIPEIPGAESFAAVRGNFLRYNDFIPILVKAIQEMPHDNIGVLVPDVVKDMQKASDGSNKKVEEARVRLDGAFSAIQQQQRRLDDAQAKAHAGDLLVQKQQRILEELQKKVEEGQKKVEEGQKKVEEEQKKTEETQKKMEDLQKRLSEVETRVFRVRKVDPNA